MHTKSSVPVSSYHLSNEISGFYHEPTLYNSLTESKKSPQWHNQYETFPHETHQWKKRWSLNCKLLIKHHVCSSNQAGTRPGWHRGPSSPDSYTQVEATNVSPRVFPMTGGENKLLFLLLRREKVRFKENADALGRRRVGCWFEPKQKCQPSFCFWRRADRGGRTRGNQPSKQALMKVGVTFPSKLNPPLTDQHPTSAVLQQRLVTVTMREIPQPLNKNRHCSGFTVK